MSDKELRINPPKVFDGNRDNFIPFIQDARVYLLLNDKSYNTDQKKIIYVLSFMNEGTAKTWKEAFLDSVFSDKNQDYGKYADFLLNIKGAFSTATQKEKQSSTTTTQTGKRNCRRVHLPVLNPRWTIQNQ